MLVRLIALDIDPNVVKPGWTPFIITLVLAAVMVFLYRSMRRQFGRIRDLPREDDRSGASAVPAASTTTASAGTSAGTSVGTPPSGPSTATGDHRSSEPGTGPGH